MTLKGQPDARPKPPAGAVFTEASSAVTLPEAAEANAKDEEEEARKPLLVAQRFSASFDGRTLLQNVDLALARRGVYALIAPTREACSALFGILSGRHREANGWTFDGDLRFNDAPLGQSVRPVVLGPQITPSRLSILSYLLQDLPSEAAADFPRPRLLNLVMEAGLGHLLRQPDAPLDSLTLPLSTGEWWLLSIARELIRDPKLICLDEPLEGISPGHSAALTRLLRQQGEHRTILLSTRSESDASACHAKPLFLPANATVQPTPAVERTLDVPAEQSAAALGHDQSPQASVPSAVFAAATSPAEAGPESPPKETSSDPIAASATVSSPSDPGRGNHPTQPLLKLSALSIQLHKLHLLPATSIEVAATGLHLIQCQRATARKALIRVLCGEPLPQLQISGCALWQGSDLLTMQGERPMTPPRQAHWLLLTGREYLQDAIHGPQRSQKVASLPTLVQFLELTGASDLLHRLDVALCDLPAHERRQLELLRCISLAPRLMVLDDPLMSTGPSERLRLLHLLRTAAKRSAVLVVVRAVGLYCGEQGLRPIQIFHCDDSDSPSDDVSRLGVRAPAPRQPSSSVARVPSLHPSSTLPISGGTQQGQRRASVADTSDPPAHLPKRVNHASL